MILKWIIQKPKEGFKSLGLFQESYMPVTLHVDTGFDFEKIIFKQTLLPLSNKGETIIFKNQILWMFNYFFN